MQPNRRNPVPPFLRWAGSKRKLIPRITALIPNDCDRYVEPFAGSACVFFSAVNGNAVLADFNHELINAFELVRRHPRILARKLARLMPNKQTYYKVREKGLGTSDIDRAVRFLFLNAHCFNGVYRTNQSGVFNVPMGTKTAGVPSEEHLVRCSIALRKAHLVCQDYMETLSQCTSTDFVYLDPPYPKSDSRDRGEYGIGAFNPEEENRLVAALKQLDRNGTKFLLSYKATNSFVSILPEAFEVRRVYVSRSVSGFARGRCRVAEVFVRNYKIIE